MNIQRKKLKIFFIFLILTDLFAYLLSYNNIMSAHEVASYMMVLPGAGVSLGMYMYEKNKLNYLNYALLLCFCAYILLILSYIFLKIIFSFFNIIIINFAEGLIVPIGMIFSVGTFLYALITSENKKDELYIFKNYKSCLKYIFIYMLIEVSIMKIFASINAFDIIKNFFYSIFVVIIVMSIFFIGEEYAWRGYLQDIFQNKFGKRIGIILLGILWETWHFPLWNSYYNVDIYGNIFRYISVVTIAIFYGYVYMKTRNIWLCTLFHSINNFCSSEVKNIEIFNKYFLFEQTNVGYGIIILFVLGILLFFTKEYRKDLT